MNPERQRALEDLALAVREHVLQMATGGGCFIGASLSCTDLLVYLYREVLRIDPQRLDDPERDYLFLSKGHDVPALYGTLAELGYFPRERLKNHLSVEDSIYWHPNRAVPGIEFHSGSLGHSLSVAIGVALDARISGTKHRCFVILGDGELNEGTIWEGLLVAKAHRLENLYLIVDRNEFQANARTEDLIPLEPLEDKFRGFGLSTARIDGHDFAALEGAFAALPPGPHVIIADTVRGKGLPSIERRADRWFVNFTADEIAQLRAELRGGAESQLRSAPQHVR